MKTPRINIVAWLTGSVIALVLFGGCATVRRDAHTRRNDRAAPGVIEFLANPANNYPANLPK
ncbi:MAG: hypothetical protein HY674_02750 [Chloroflexi bacterium]|nr:hypothetical protein [Chloroflexota bacterium]